MRAYEAAQVIGIETTAVVHGEIPVAVRPARTARPGAPQGYRRHATQASQPAGDVVSELLISHTRQGRAAEGPGAVARGREVDHLAHCSGILIPGNDDCARLDLPGVTGLIEEGPDCQDECWAYLRGAG